MALGEISGLLESDDCMATLKVFKTLGVTIEKNNNTYTVYRKRTKWFKKNKQ